ncbi:zinc ribbon domain-containing protein [Clostridium sp. C8-1-8]|uniref:zinc ribbon domain-containing protein n=1 Tax=Clostridium sp. C8-1-8 TaxID=2698831 RepID=UPI001FAC987A|nr:zinc ribbon domain-containing protein [Clostridium sp. C8-1-8]
MGIDDFLKSLGGKHHGDHHGNHHTNHKNNNHNYRQDHYDDSERLDYIQEQHDYSQKDEVECPKCSTTIPLKSKFCPNCGVSLNPILKCNGCGAKMPLGATFCSECGLKAR